MYVICCREQGIQWRPRSLAHSSRRERVAHPAHVDGRRPAAPPDHDAVRPRLLRADRGRVHGGAASGAALERPWRHRTSPLHLTVSDRHGASSNVPFRKCQSLSFITVHGQF